MSAGSTCIFPVGADVCGVPVTPRPGPGRPRTYCDNPQHTALGKHRYEQRVAKARAAAEQPPATVAERVAVLGAAVARIERLKGELVAELADAEELVADLADSEQNLADLDRVETIALARVRQAEAARQASDVIAEIAREDAAQAQRNTAEVRNEASDAVSRMRTDCDREVARVLAVADAEITRATTAQVLAKDRPRRRISAV
ncbi:MAG: hypothetical protein JWN03_1149 [Nocardia sp.]|uniref:hypothetical protein n=1 Tax=Nocardia sp. TaxID=1821 RepID=UPI002604681F|nr:hypothetical protein [Nocardia sp.]MCU1640874.1 hypothetical protein [Nocardia sp.]